MDASEESPSHFSFSAQSFRYWEIFLSWLFKYPSRCYEHIEVQESQVFKNICPSLYELGQTYHAPSTTREIICHVTDQKEDIEKTRQILEQIYKDGSDSLLIDYATAEVLAKVLAYRELSEKDIILIPTLKQDGTSELLEYIVDKVFDLWSKVRAFGLSSTHSDLKAPLLLFRGTDLSVFREGGRGSIISDLDPKGPGRALFEVAEKELQVWLKDHTNAKIKARLIGHSLGGIIVGYTLLSESDYISSLPHETSYAFNAPGVTVELLDKWETLQQKKPLAYKSFISRGDVVSKFGHLFGTVLELSLDKPLSPLRAHEELLFSKPLCYCHPVDLEKENRSGSRQFYSKLHKQTSSMIYEFGLKFLFPN